MTERNKMWVNREPFVKARSTGSTAEDTALGPLLSGTLRVIRHRKILAVAVFSLVAIPASVYIGLRPLTYEATARILLEPSDEARTVIKENASGDELSAELQTQMQVLRSRPLVAKAIASGRLWQMPGFNTGATVSSTGSEAELSAAGLVDAVLSRLTIRAVPGTRILSITYESTDPATAMTVVNTLVKTHIDESSRAQRTASGGALDWLNQRLAEARDNLQKSEMALQAYAETQGDVSLEDRQNIVVQKLADLSTAVTRAKTQRIAKQTLYEQLQKMQDGQASIDTLPIILQNGALQQLRAQLAELKRKELVLSQDLGDRHPDLITLRAEIASTDARLKADLAKVVDSVRNEFVAAQSEEQNLVRALDAQKIDVLDLSRKGVEFAALQRQAASDQEIYEKLLNEAQTRTITGKTAQTKIQIVESAETPRQPIGLSKVRQLAFAIFSALLLALTAPIVRESLDQRVKTAADLERGLNVDCLAMVPAVRSSRNGNALLVTTEANSFNEAFRRLRTTLLVTASATGSTRVLVTSVAPREGKSVVAANLATVLAQTHQRVLLVDGDLRRPTVHKLMKVQPFPGFADLLTGDAPIAEVIRQTQTPGLFVLPCGLKHGASFELLSSAQIDAVLKQLEDQKFDWIVFDSPPLGPVADACVIGQWVHQAVLVTSAGTTPAEGARLALAQLENAKVPVAGAILNRVDLHHSAYYYAPYYARGYGDYYTTRSAGARRAAAEPG
jgi:polysaccharide biosynthesis transport protein